MNRRDLITLLGGAAAWPAGAKAQQGERMPVIGALSGVSAKQWTGRMAGFRRGLGESGYVEGQNIRIEYRWAEGQFDRLPKLAAELVGHGITALFAGGSAPAIQAAIAATQTIPIVFATNIDPVAAGFVESLNRPGRNVTGISLIGSDLAAKNLEMMHEAIPTATTIALLVNPNNSFTSDKAIEGAQNAANQLGLQIIIVQGGTENEIEIAFATALQDRVAAVMVSNDAFLGTRIEQIATLGLRHALPTICSTREGVAAGELMGYGSNQSDGYRQAGTYVGRILKGEKPADLPVVQSTKFELVVNLKTAKALGLTIPESFLLRADEVIE